MAEDKDGGPPVEKPSQSATPPSRTSFGTMVFVGAASIAGAYSSGLFTPDRYPLRTEYEIVKTCVDGGVVALSRQHYLDKLERCQCSLEATMKKVSHEELLKKENDFMSVFQTSTEVCRKKGRS